MNWGKVSFSFSDWCLLGGPVSRCSNREHCMGQLWELHPCMLRPTQVWELTWGGRNAACSFKVNLKVRHLYLDASHCATFDHGCWDWRLLLPVQTSFPSGVSTPSYTPSMAGGLNQTQHFSEPQTTSCEVAPPGGRDRHWCSRSRNAWVRTLGNWGRSKAGTTISWEHHTARGQHSPCCFGSFLVPCHGRRRQSEAKGCCIRSWF